MRSKYTRLSLWLKWKVILKPLASLRTETICFRNASRLEFDHHNSFKADYTGCHRGEKSIKYSVILTTPMANSRVQHLISLLWEEPSSAVKREYRHISLRKSAVLPQTTENSMFFHNAFLLKCTNFKMLVFPESSRTELLLECSTLHVLTNIRTLSQ